MEWGKAGMGVAIVNRIVGNSLVVQWLGLSAFMTVAPGRGTKIPQAAWRSPPPNKKELLGKGSMIS